MRLAGLGFVFVLAVAADLARVTVTVTPRFSVARRATVRVNVIVRHEPDDARSTSCSTATTGTDRRGSRAGRRNT